MRLREAIVLALLVATPSGQMAQAAGEQSARVPLAEVLALARDYPNLYLQVRLQLVRANLKRDDVSCAARSLPASLGKLAGTAVAPYSCTIGKRTVEITARQTFYDANGHKLGSAAASMAKAVRVAQANLTWRWR